MTDKVRHTGRHGLIKTLSNHSKICLNKIFTALMEKRCSLCSTSIQNDPNNPIYYKLSVCSECKKKLLPRKYTFCPQCGEFFAAPTVSGICQNCQFDPPPWEKIFFYGPYQYYLRKMILQVKFSEGLPQAAALGRLLLLNQSLHDNAATYSCIIPIPLHKSRLIKRGFNQAIEIFRPVAQALLIPMNIHCLYRIRPTSKQYGLTRKERKKNVASAFAVSTTVQGQKILLVDDVLTTGATLISASKCLLEAGAEKVDVAVIARTPAKNMLSPGVHKN